MKSKITILTAEEVVELLMSTKMMANSVTELKINLSSLSIVTLSLNLKTIRTPRTPIPQLHPIGYSPSTKSEKSRLKARIRSLMVMNSSSRSERSRRKIGEVS